MTQLRQALRRAGRTPVFSLMIVLVLGIGIGLSAAVFNIVNAVLLKPLPYPNAERLVWIWGTSPRFATASVTPADYQSYREQARSFEQLAAAYTTRLDIVGDAEPQRLPGAMVSWNYFAALGAPPAYGRTFNPSDEQQTIPQVVVISDGVWQRLFGGARDIIGRTIRLERQSVTVVGVMPARFRPPVAADLWIPFPLASPSMASRSAHFLRPIGLLRSGATLAEAQRELHAIAGTLQKEFPKTNAGWTATVITLHTALIGRVNDSFRMLWTIVGCVLVMACANAAGLLMARVISRQREFNLRLALGASEVGVVRQVLVETLTLAILGGVLGVAIARWSVELLLAIGPDSIPLPDQVGIDLRVMAFILGVATLTGLISGLAPAIHACRSDQRAVLQESRTTVGPAARRTLGAFVVVEFALALVLVTAAGLMIRNFVALSSVQPGFTVDGLVTGEVALSPVSFASSDRRVAFWANLLDRIRSTAGVDKVAFVSQLPFSGQGNDVYFYPEGRAPSGADQMVTADFRQVTADYFAAMEIPVVKGQAFTDQDARTRAKRVAISERLAAQYFPGADPLGQRLMIGAPKAEAYEIVGVVGDVRHRSVTASPAPTMYVPSLDASPFTIVIRTRGDEDQMVSTMRAVVKGVDPDQPVARAMTMAALIGNSLGPARLTASLLSAFGVVAVILAGSGIFAVMAFSVAMRTRDIGIHMALGAKPHWVRSTVLRQGLWLALAGLLLGVPSVFLANKVFGALFPVTIGNLPMVGATALLLVVTAVLACYIPARRATTIDPIVALRRD